MKEVILDGDSLTLAETVSVARQYIPVRLSKNASVKVSKASAYLTDIVDHGRVIYGVTTGFGVLSDVLVSPEKITQAQRNLILSHAAGVGPAFPEAVVRAAMLLRANTLAKGYSGVQLKTLETLIEMLNKKVHPVIPVQGSVGASGDLAPLAHLVLVMIGEGKAEYHKTIMTGRKALESTSITPVKLSYKEGIALINGTQIMTGITALTVFDAETLVTTSELAAAMSLEAIEGLTDPFTRQIHQLRPHAGQVKSAEVILQFIKKSEFVDNFENLRSKKEAVEMMIIDSIKNPQKQSPDNILSTIHRIIKEIHDIESQREIEDDPKLIEKLQKQKQSLIVKLQGYGLEQDLIGKLVNTPLVNFRVQDAYSFRCAPQVIGVCRDAIDYVKKVVSIELNSVTDNPILFPNEDIIVSGGNFHGQPIALASDLLSIALCELGSITERRIARLVDSKLNHGLPMFLIQPKANEKGIHSGLALAHMTAAALTSENKVLSSPASIDSIPTSANQEDFVSMGTHAARKASQILNNVQHIVGIELLCAAQAIDLRNLRFKRALGLGTRITYDMIRKSVPRIDPATGLDRLTNDILISDSINQLVDLVKSGSLTGKVQKG